VLALYDKSSKGLSAGVKTTTTAPLPSLASSLKRECATDIATIIGSFDVGILQPSVMMFGLPSV